jgi:hypothetical protein
LQPPNFIYADISPQKIINNVFMWNLIINIKVDPNQQNTKSNFAVEPKQTNTNNNKKHESKRWLVWSENKRTLTTTKKKKNESKRWLVWSENLFGHNSQFTANIWNGADLIFFHFRFKKIFDLYLLHLLRSLNST